MCVCMYNFQQALMQFYIHQPQQVYSGQINLDYSRTPTAKIYIKRRKLVIIHSKFSKNIQIYLFFLFFSTLRSYLHILQIIIIAILFFFYSSVVCSGYVCLPTSFSLQFSRAIFYFFFIFCSIVSSSFGLYVQLFILFLFPLLFFFFIYHSYTVTHTEFICTKNMERTFYILIYLPSTVIPNTKLLM